MACDECDNWRHRAEGAEMRVAELSAGLAGYSFRLLTDGDIICDADEFLEDDCQTWTTTKEARIWLGMPYLKNFFVPMRRKLQRSPRLTCLFLGLV